MTSEYCDESALNYFEVTINCSLTWTLHALLTWEWTTGLTSIIFMVVLSTCER